MIITTVDIILNVASSRDSTWLWLLHPGKTTPGHLSNRPGAHLQNSYYQKQLQSWILLLKWENLPEKLEQMTFEWYQTTIIPIIPVADVLRRVGGLVTGLGGSVLRSEECGSRWDHAPLAACLQRNVLLIQSTKYILSMRTNLSNSKHLLVAPI